MTGCAAGATRASFTSHFSSLSHNAADISAKEGMFAFNVAVVFDFFFGKNKIAMTTNCLSVFSEGRKTHCAVRVSQPKIPFAVLGVVVNHAANDVHRAPVGKAGSQEAIATAIGSVLGAAITWFTAESAVAAWVLFLLLTAFHLYGNSKNHFFFKKKRGREGGAICSHAFSLIGNCHSEPSANERRPASIFQCVCVRS